MEVLEYDCPECCGTVFSADCLCNELPATLYATPSSAVCVCANSASTIALVYNSTSNKWEGCGTVCGHSVCLAFLCDNGSPTATACSPGGPSAAGKMTVTWGDACHATTEFTPTHCDCSGTSYSATFQTTAIGCCTLLTQDIIIWTITN
jgi:hypothetical protein